MEFDAFLTLVLDGRELLAKGPVALPLQDWLPLLI